MHKCLYEYSEGKFEELLTALGDHGRVVEHLQHTVRLALDHYHTWQAKRNTKHL